MYWLVSLAALTGVVLNIKKHAACFYLWSCTNAVWAIADWIHGLHAQAALMVVYRALAVYGAWAWRKEKAHGG